MQSGFQPMTLDCFVAFAPSNDGIAASINYSAACCATVGSVPATVARRISRGCDWS